MMVIQADTCIYIKQEGEKMSLEVRIQYMDGVAQKRWSVKP
jgi:hypothetical protein